MTFVANGLLYFLILKGFLKSLVQISWFYVQTGVGLGPFIQSTKEHSYQMYFPLMSVPAGKVAAKIEDLAPSSGVNGPLWDVMSVSTYPTLRNNLL